MTKCYVCGVGLPKEFAHIHHITPQSTGAHADDSADNTVVLCASDHHNLHAIATKLLSGKTAVAVDLAESFYTDGEAIRKVMVLAGHVARETIAMREGERDLPAMVLVSVELPREDVTMLKILALEQMGPRQFEPFLRELLTGISRKARGRQADHLPAIEHTTFKG